MTNTHFGNKGSSSGHKTSCPETNLHSATYMKPNVTDPLPIGTQINRRKEEIQAALNLTDGGNNTSIHFLLHEDLMTSIQQCIHATYQYSVGF
jgi:hypothetical protein